MLVTTDAAKLIGYIRPVTDQPGFVLLVFRTKTSNESLTQVIGTDDHVMGFRTVDSAMIAAEPDRQDELRIGDEALWGYAFADQPPYVGPRGELVGWLRERVHGIADPLLRLQAADFCAMADDRSAAWRASFDHLAAVSPSSATAWRDVIVLPAEIRRSVARAIRKHGIEAINDLGRDVGIDVDGEALVVSFAHDLFETLQAHPSALLDIDGDTADVRHAFGLNNPLEMIADERFTGGDAWEPTVMPVVVAVGSRAQQVVDRLVRIPEVGGSKVVGVARDAHERPASTLTVWEADRLFFEGDAELADIDPELPLTFEAERPDLLFVFGASAGERNVARAAVRLARTVDSRRYRCLAVIPHLPDPALSRSSNEYEELLSSFATGFEAVFLLSDHSPHLRYGLPYGPSRSCDASAARLKYLISALQAGKVESIDGLSMSATEGLPVHVLSSISSSGVLSAPRLFDYALGGATAFTLDRTARTRLNLVLTRDGHRDEANALEGPVRRAGFSELTLTYHQTWPAPRGAKAELHFEQVAWRPLMLSEFADFCIRELTGHGWRVTSPDGTRADAEVTRRDVRILTEFKAFGVDDGARPLRTPTKRRLGEDIVLVTDCTVYRGDYIRHVLQGRLPINVSRLNVLQTVYARRYAYLIRALHGKEVRYKSRITEAAFARLFDVSTRGYSLQLAGIVSNADGRKVEIDADATQVSTVYDGIHVVLVVRVTSEQGDPSRHVIDVILTQSGWQISNWTSN
ncbi:hypothetical protein E5673_14755 [Sphingomonas sp. PAMC26645]|uniref:hypothetical protein n=1 Tax=Sphingomonas sp. PAMC26645 TaxID=2565555 RepID=UPI00109E0BBA|nr:hypothetical protein [Sphingomonas sp. PAMC26645]QCB43329.1 hypothetical protein E5673_14755 [Sphingomonas sp. PAMC26645]